MPAELQSRPIPTSSVSVAISAPVELGFSLFAFQRTSKPQSPSRPWVEPVMAAHPDLAARMETLWATVNDRPGEWGEILVLAHRAGHLLDPDMDGFLADLPAVAALDLPSPPLPSETPEEEASVHRKLRALRDFPELREAFGALLRDFWAALQPWWEPAGRESAIDYAAQLRERLDRGADWRNVVVCSLAWREPCASLLEAAHRRGELVIVPLALNREGQLTYALPGIFVLAAGPDAGRKTERRRARAEKTAATFKLFGDPTRNQILFALLHAPYSVTDLASVFELSQPTVSVHVKILREAGLLDAERPGAQTRYRASEQRVRAALARASEELLVEGD